jgi:predicted Fe-Mo cluster-binding NifX family protein
MKLLATATGPSLQSEIDDDFGHSAYFVVFDTETQSYEAHVNKAGESSVGSGLMAAEQIVSLNPDVVLTSYIGPHGQRELRKAGIRIVMDEEGTVWSSIERFMKKNPECQTKDRPAVTAPPE